MSILILEQKWPVVCCAVILSAVSGLFLGRFALRIADLYAPCRYYGAPLAGGREITPGAAGDPAGHRLRRWRRPCLRDVAVQLLSAVLLTVVVARFGVAWEAFPPLLAACGLLVLSLVDLRSYRLPDAIVMPASAVSLAAVAVVSLITGKPSAVAPAVAAAFGYGVLLLTVHGIRPGGLGFGDVKLAPLLGLHLGWTAAVFHHGWIDVVELVGQALLISGLIGLLMGLSVAVLRRMGFDILPDPAADPGGPTGVRLVAERRAKAGSCQQVGCSEERTNCDVQNTGCDARCNDMKSDGPGSASPRLLETGFPFGPALASGTMIAVLFSEALLG